MRTDLLWQDSTNCSGPVSALAMLRIERGEEEEATRRHMQGQDEEHKQRGENRKISRKKLCLLQQSDWKLSLGITQLVGPAGAGKTQLALGLCVQSVLDGNKAVYVSLGSASGGSKGLIKVSLRLRTMFAARTSLSESRLVPSAAGAAATVVRSLPNAPGTESTVVNRLLSRVWVRWVPNTDEFLELLQQKLPRLLQQDSKISLVVLDGIASLFRIRDNEQCGDSRNHNAQSAWYLSRSTTFFQLASQCKYLSSVYQIPIVITNEVTSRLTGQTINQSKCCTSSLLEPALGLSWVQCVDTSFFVSRHEAVGNNVDSKPQVDNMFRRELCCVQSARIRCGKIVAFSIGREGPVPIVTNESLYVT